MDHSHQLQFKQDTLELIEKLEQTLLSLEQTPDSTNLVEEAFRALHTIKGASFMFGFQEVGNFSHELENLFVVFRDGTQQINQSVINLTLEALDHARLLLNNSEDDSLKGATETLIQRAKLAQFTRTNSSIEKVNQLYLVDIFMKEPLDMTGGLPITFLFDDIKDVGDYLQWKDNDNEPFTHTQFLILTTQTAESIEALFIFYEDDLEATIHSLSITRPTTQQLQDLNLTPPWGVQDLELWFQQNTQKTALDELLFSKSSENKDLTQEAKTIRVGEDKINELMESVSELVTLQARFKEVAQNLENIEFQNAFSQLEQVVSRIRTGVFSISLMPISTQKTRFQRLIRDLSAQLQKQVRFETIGEETELDKLVVESLTEPLLHIFRNALDHAIESPQERIALGKNPESKLLLHAYYSGANVFLEIKDDGRGIDPQIIAQKAIEKGLLASDHNKTDDELIQIIFQAGFSTAQNVSDISGRGVGMDVVKRQIQALRGKVEIASEIGKGTTIRIKLPLTISIIDGLLLKCANTFLVVPLSSVESIIRVKASEIASLQNKFASSLTIENRQVALIDLNHLFDGQQNSNHSIDKMILLVLDAHGKEKGIVIDAVLGEIQAVLKPLGRWYTHQDFLSGSTILGNGELALVIDIEKLLDKK